MSKKNLVKPLDLTVVTKSRHEAYGPDLDESAHLNSSRMGSYNPTKKFAGVSSADLRYSECIKSTKRIKALICYICHKEFNIKRIEDHLK